jgi:IQ calmodulin-binding motif
MTIVSFNSSAISSRDEDSRLAGSSANTSVSSSDLKSPASTLCNKFDELDKTWSVYHKFGGLEKKWSQFGSNIASVSIATTTNVAVDTSAPTYRTLKVVKLQDLEEKWAQLHAFATGEKKNQEQLQQRLKQQQLVNRRNEIEETRDDTEQYSEGDETKGGAASTEKQREVHAGAQLTRLERDEWEEGGDHRTLDQGELDGRYQDEQDVDRHKDEHHEAQEKQPHLEHKEHHNASEHTQNTLDKQPQHEPPQLLQNNKPAFVMKRRGAKRPRRMLALTKVRNWNFGLRPTENVSGDDEALCYQEEEVLFVDETKTVDPDASKANLQADDVKHPNGYWDDEGTDDQVALSRLTRRVLISMTNEELWQHFKPNYPCEGRFREQSASFSGFEDQSTDDGQCVGAGKQLERIVSRVRPTQVGTHDMGEARCGAGVQKHLAMLCGSVGTNRLMPSHVCGSDDALHPVVRDLLHFRLCTVSAVVIQSFIRMRLARRRYMQVRAQAAGETTRRRRGVLSHTVARIHSVRKFQAVERCRKSAVAIQSAFRGRVQRISYINLKLAVVAVQNWFRRLSTKQRRLTVAKIQRSGSVRPDMICSHDSSDRSGISPLSFDDSYQYDDPELPFPSTCHAYKTLSVALDPEHPITVCPLPPLYPASSPPLCPSSPPSNITSTSRPCAISRRKHLPLPRIPPSCRPPSPAPRLQRLPSAHPVGPEDDALQNRRSKALPSKQRMSSPSHNLSTKRQSRRSRAPRRSSLSPLPSKRKPPLANVITPSIGDKSGQNGRHKAESKAKNRSPKPGQKIAIPRSHSLRETSNERYLQHEPKHLAAGEPAYLRNGVVDLLACSGKPTGSASASDVRRESSIKIQKIWRGYQSQLKLVSLLLKAWNVICDCSNGRVARDRLLRQRAQTLCMSKAIGQVGCLGADEWLSCDETVVVAQWKNILYVKFDLANGEVINTFATVIAETTVRRTKRIESMSRVKLFMLAIKATLQQQFFEQQHKAQRISLFERSLTRRRAPVEKDAATTIQREVRRRLWTNRYTRFKRNALLIQKEVRRLLAKIAYRRKQEAALLIQTFFRGELVRSIVFQFWAAATAFRSFWNNHRKERLASVDSVAAKMQATFRGSQQRRRFLQCLSAATLIQTEVRSMAAQKKFRRLRRSCVSLQIIMRGKIAFRIRREEESALCIQQWYRFEQYNQMMRNLCITIIQASFRRCREYRRYRSLRGAAVKIQAAMRRMVARKLCHRLWLSIINTQRLYRGQRVRRSVYEWTASAIRISSWFRGTSQKRSFEKQRREVLLANLCAIQIQAQYRRFYVQCSYQQFLFAIMILQFQTRYVLKVSHLYPCLASFFSLTQSVRPEK